jgi:hypothetical protein
MGLAPGLSFVDALIRQEKYTNRLINTVATTEKPDGQILQTLLRA